MKRNDLIDYLGAIALLLSFLYARQWLGYVVPPPLIVFSAIAMFVFATAAIRLAVRRKWPAPPAADPAGPVMLHAGEAIRPGAPVELRGELVFEVPALDIWPARLASLVMWSGLFADKQEWTGTALGLRAALCAPVSRLHWRNHRELPPADVIELKLRGMVNGRGRLVVEQVGVEDGTISIWKIKPSAVAAVSPEPPAS